MKAQDVDVVVVGAGFAGLYLLHRLRALGLSCRVFDKAEDVGGTWYWNRYPGARCDIESIDYSYSFDPDLEKEWQWSEKYATQPEILRYLQFVADKYELRRDITFSTSVISASWDENTNLWQVTTDSGETITSRFTIMASGCLSQPKVMDIPGADTFEGDTYFSHSWPHEGVDFSGKRVAVLGTGSSGIQCIPLIAKQAEALTVFQRTANYSIPALNGMVSDYKKQALEKDREHYRELARWSRGGVHYDAKDISALSVSDADRASAYEHVWQSGTLVEMVSVFNDIITNESANDTIAEFMRNKIRGLVKDPEVAETLCPSSYPFGTKRPCMDTDYFETYNLPHVSLVNILKTPVTSITSRGVETSEQDFEFDAVVFATGFDAMTGAIAAVDIKGKDGLLLKQAWKDGPGTYLGLMAAGFPNLFLVTGPGSPSVLSNMAVSIEQNVEWITDCIKYMDANSLQVIEATEKAQNGWVKHVREFADITLYPHANSWYMGANVADKPRVFLPYVGGVDTYRAVCNEVVEKDYLGFSFSEVGEENIEHCQDGLIWPMQPDVGMMLRFIDSLELPPLEEGTVEEARAFSVATAEQQAPGPDVGEVIDGQLPGAESDLEYRLYRPETEGPHPVTLYFHGGGWVFGDHTTDDPFCRYLCKEADSVVISVNYRHAPEARFPAAADDGMAALSWVVKNMEQLGGNNKIAVSGWSAGGNVAAVVCQTAREIEGIDICGQLLLTPVTDADFTRPSYQENEEGYVLTRGLMQWFWDHYADTPDRSNPKASPLKAESLAGLPQAMVVTCEFDPLRDEGKAYADAMVKAGVEVEHLNCEGHVHTSITAVGAITTSESARVAMAQSLVRFFSK